MARIWAHSLQVHGSVACVFPLAGKIVGRRSACKPFSRCTGSMLPSSCSSTKRCDARSESVEQCSSFSSLRAVRLASRSLSTRVPHPNSSLQRSHIPVVSQASSGSIDVEGSEAKPKADREILVQHLLLKEDQLPQLLEIQRKITQEGLDLSDLAAEYSICPSKEDGGMLGWISLGQTDRAFEEAAFGAPVNKLVRVKTKHGWHLLQVLGERQAMKLEQIQVEDFHERMQEPSFLEEAQLVDVREPDEIDVASIKGFEAYPLSRFGHWAPNIADDLDPEKDTYVLCHHGMRSMQAAQWLQTQGFRRLYNIVGGIHAYSKKVDSSIPTY